MYMFILCMHMKDISILWQLSEQWLQVLYKYYVKSMYNACSNKLKQRYTQVSNIILYT